MNYWGRATRRLEMALAAAFCLFSLGHAPAQEPAGAVSFEGTQVFRRHVLHDLFKLTPVSRFGELFEASKDSLLIIFGETKSLADLGITPPLLEDFRKRKGAILIASDREDGGHLGPALRIAGNLVHQPAKNAYHHLEACPFIEKRYVDAEHPIFRGLTKGLATNQPSYLYPNRDSLRVLATLPPYCQILEDNHRRVIRRDPLPYIEGGDPAAPPLDRVLVIAGHGVFMNGMMAQRDNDNFAFASNCIRWLTDGGKRKRVLFVEEGSVQDHLDVPIKALPAPPMPPSQVVEKILRGLEEESFFDKLLLRFHDRILRLFILLLSAVLLVYGLLRLVRGRHHPQHGVPLLAGETILASTALPVMAQRDRDVVREGNLWEAARSLARSCFDRVGDPWHGHAAHVPPRVVAAGWRKRLRRARQVRQLWELAYGARPLPVTPRRYAQVAALVQEVQAALADGSLRFEDHGHPPKSE